MLKNKQAKAEKAEKIKECKKSGDFFWREAFFQCRGHRNLYVRDACEEEAFKSLMDQCVKTNPGNKT